MADPGRAEDKGKPFILHLNSDPENKTLGNSFSKDEAISNFVKELIPGPDLGVDKHLMKFTSLSSTENLKKHYETRRMEVGNKATDLLKDLAALAIAVLIDHILSPSEDNIEENLRSVFAEERVSEVRDLIDECLKRFTMHGNSTDKLKNDIERIESQLSVALTKLKNSMLRDGNMSNQAVKVWVNGVAFHIQMLIQGERLRKKPKQDPIKSLLSVYQRDVDQIFQVHEEVVKGKCSKKEHFIDAEPLCLCVCHFEGEDSSSYDVSSSVSLQAYFKAYYKHRYGRAKPSVQKYLSEVKQNLPKLVCQKGSFNPFENRAGRRAVRSL